jgi:hypothetical protein
MRQAWTAVKYLHSPSEELNAATAAYQVGILELMRTMAEAFYAERLALPGFSASRLNNARSHLDLAAANTGTIYAGDQSIKAWDNLDG